MRRRAGEALPPAPDNRRSAHRRNAPGAAEPTRFTAMQQKYAGALTAMPNGTLRLRFAGDTGAALAPRPRAAAEGAEARLMATRRPIDTATAHAQWPLNSCSPNATR